MLRWELHNREFSVERMTEHVSNIAINQVMRSFLIPFK